MRLILYIVLLFWMSEGYAKHGDERARLLINAKSIKDLDKKLGEFDSKSKHTEACKWELRRQVIPRSCYFISLSNDQQIMVDEVCKKAASLLKAEASVDRLSQKCNKYVSEKNEDLRYRFREEDPARYIFK